MDILLFDTALRGAATGITCVMLALVLASRISREAQICLAVLTISTTARAWSSLPPGVNISAELSSILRLVGSGGAVAMTWFMLIIFLDDRRFFWAWIASGALISISLPLNHLAPEWIPLQRGYAAVHFLGLLVLALQSRQGDLQDARRRMRPAVIAFLSVYCVGLSLASTPMKGAASAEAALIQSSTLTFILAFFAVWALKANLANWPGVLEPTAPSQPTVVEKSQAQEALIARINAAMADGIWQVEGLTVSALAQKVDAPEHQVRRAINQVLGHRNFASFINRARIDAAKAQLRDSQGASKTVLEIAYDVGFSSLGPFNRAFRDVTGQSPTDFRKQSLG